MASHIHCFGVCVPLRAQWDAAMCCPIVCQTAWSNFRAIQLKPPFSTTLPVMPFDQHIWYCSADYKSLGVINIPMG